MKNVLTKAGLLLGRGVTVLGSIVALCACSVTPSNTSLDLGQVEQWLPGDYLGEGSTGAVYHRIVALDVPDLGGTVFYHHISRQGFGLEPFQRKFYRFDASGQVMRSTVVLGVGEPLGSKASLSDFLGGLEDKDLLRFPSECLFRWSAGPSGLMAELAAEHCAYTSPAFGGIISPQMTYRLDRCSLSIDEALYRDNGEPVFAPSSTNNRRIGASAQTAEGC